MGTQSSASPALPTVVGGANPHFRRCSVATPALGAPLGPPPPPAFPAVRYWGGEGAQRGGADSDPFPTPPRCPHSSFAWLPLPPPPSGTRPPQGGMGEGEGGVPPGALSEYETVMAALGSPLEEELEPAATLPLPPLEPRMILQVGPRSWGADPRSSGGPLSSALCRRRRAYSPPASCLPSWGRRVTCRTWKPFWKRRRRRRKPRWRQ